MAKNDWDLKKKSRLRKVVMRVMMIEINNSQW